MADAFLATICNQRVPMVACWTMPVSGRKKNIIVHFGYDCKGQPIPAGVFSVVDPTVEIGTLFTDVAGKRLVVDPRDVAVGACCCEDLIWFTDCFGNPISNTGATDCFGNVIDLETATDCFGAVI